MPKVPPDTLLQIILLLYKSLRLKVQETEMPKSGSAGETPDNSVNK